MSEVVLKAPVKATFGELDAPEATPGAYNFYVNFGEPADAAPKGMIYVCPCGCGQTGRLRFRPAPSPSWEWDGNREAPTLSPSVHHVGHWHGYLRAGLWVQA